MIAGCREETVIQKFTIRKLKCKNKDSNKKQRTQHLHSIQLLTDACATYKRLKTTYEMFNSYPYDYQNKSALEKMTQELTLIKQYA